MRKTVSIGLAAGVLLAGTLLIGGPGWSENPESGALPYLDAERVAEGREIYEGYCASCHGANLEGEANWQSRNGDGYLPAPPHDETGHTWHHDTALLTRIVREGTEAIVGGSYKSNMMGFGDVLSDTEIASVLGYIKSTWPTEIQDIHNEIDTRSLP